MLIMEVPEGLLLLLFLHFFTGDISATLVTSCGACHNEATCLETQRGDSFSGKSFSCVCRSGYSGDGLNCYDEPPSSQSVQFVFEETACPPGMEYIAVGAGAACADPCHYFKNLYQDWRSTNNTSTEPLYCDQTFIWKGYYRLFLGFKSAQIPERCIPSYRCGTHAPMWLTEPHPTQPDEIVTRTLCNSWGDSCCYHPSHTIKIKLCHEVHNSENFYIYKFVKPSACNLAFCTEIKQSLIQIVCGKKKIQIGLNLNHLKSSGLDPLSGHMAASNCSKFKERGDNVWYEVETQEGVCGNMFMANHTHIMYSNNLFIYSANNASFIPPERFPFSCVYPLLTDASMNVAVKSSLQQENGISGFGGKPGASMFLFKNSSYSETYPAGQVTLPVGSPLYVGVSVEEMNANFAVVLENCVATHSLNPADPPRYPLIQNKCPVDRRNVSVLQNGSSLQARFIALLFLLDDENQKVYLHCELSLCDRRSSNCVPVCQNRRIRSVSSSVPTKPVSIGPIVWGK